MSFKRLSRRTVLQGLAATAIVRTLPSFARTPASPRWVLLGTGSGQGIYRAPWNAATGELGTPELAVTTPHPTYLCVHPFLPVLYACNEDTGDAAAVSAFRLNRDEAALTPMGHQPSHGDAPCFVSVDRTGRLLFAANYGGGSLACFPLETSGQPAPADRVFSCAGSNLCGVHGPVQGRQDAPHLHCAVLSPDNRFVLACDLGDDALLAFPIHPASPHPLENPVRFAARRGSGPRHLAFHPNGRWLYCIHELDCTVDLYRWASHGPVPSAALVPGSAVSIRPATVSNATGPVTAAEIAISRDGRFLYASTRGVDLLTVFRIAASDGRLTQVQQLPCGGATPRFFALDPTQRWLVCPHQDGNSITTFARDAATGRLTQRSTQTAGNPECVVWV